MKINFINKLNKKLELQELIKMPDGAGGFIQKWNKIKE